MAAFFSCFFTYLLIFLVSIVALVIAIKLGRAWRLKKDARLAEENQSAKKRKIMKGNTK